MRRPTTHADRVRSFILLDANAVLTRVEKRRDEMLALFSRLRDRQPLLAALASGLESVTFTELASLEPDEQRAVAAFAERLAEMRWYARYTEDMPLQAAQQIDQQIAALSASHRLLLAVVGRSSAKAKVVDLAPKRLPSARRKRAKKSV